MLIEIYLLLKWRNLLIQHTNDGGDARSLEADV